MRLAGLAAHRQRRKGVHGPAWTQPSHDDVLGDAVRKILLARIATKVVERRHGNGGLTAGVAVCRGSMAPRNDRNRSRSDTCGSAAPHNPLEFDLLRDRYRIIHFYAEVAHGALQLGMTEEQLNRTNVPSLLVD